MAVENRIIRLRRDASTLWTAHNPTLNEGELGVELDTRLFKFGDGATPWNSLPYATVGNSGGFYAPTSSLGSPTLITGGLGISVANVAREYQFVAGNGGPVSVSSNPAIAHGSSVGQELVLEGTNNNNSVTIPGTANGVDLNGTVILKSGSRIYLIWNGSKWGEVARK